MRKRKTISIEKIVAKANAELLFQSHADARTDAVQKDSALTRFETIKFMIMDFGGYDGFNYLNHKTDVVRVLRKYVDSEVDANGFCKYGERDIVRVMDAYEVVRQRIADKWYTETGNDYDSLFPDGVANPAGKWTEWVNYSNKELEEENFIFLY